MVQHKFESYLRPIFFSAAPTALHRKCMLIHLKLGNRDVHQLCCCFGLLQSTPRLNQHHSMLDLNLPNNWFEKNVFLNQCMLEQTMMFLNGSSKEPKVKIFCNIQWTFCLILTRNKSGRSLFFLLQPIA